MYILRLTLRDTTWKIGYVVVTVYPHFRYHMYIIYLISFMTWLQSLVCVIFMVCSKYFTPTVALLTWLI